MAVTVLRVEGMREDTRTDEERGALEAAERRPLDMSAVAVLVAARQRTGLDDFGSLDFVDRLGMLLAEVEADDNCWRTAKAQFVATCVQAASNRLLIQQYLTEHPEALDAPIDRPVIVVGLPRSGTTHLENLLAADRRLRHLPVYLAAQPVLSPGEADVDGRDPRWVRAEQRWQALKASPILAAMHEHSPDHACGDNELQMPDFASYQWEWVAQVPRWRDHYLATDQTPHYRYAREVLQALAWQQPGEERWLLKSNQHNEQLPALLATYPDATVVMIHRDPVATLQSLLTMRGLLVKSSQRVPDIDTHVAYWVARIEGMLRAYVRDMHVVPDDQRVDLLFHEVMADDVGAAAQVFERAGLPVTDECRADLAAYMAGHERGRAGRVVYDLRGDFRLEPDALCERFGFYLDRFPVRIEGAS